VQGTAVDLGYVQVVPVVTMTFEKRADALVKIGGAGRRLAP
jgi:hypothetical protein